MLGSPVGAVVAATDAAATRAFLASLGAVTDREHGCVDVVPGSGAWSRSAFAGGPAALDFYARSVATLPHVTVPLGPLVMHQARVTGPDGLPVVLIDASHRRPSLLDSTDLPVSEAHSMVWVVPSVDEALALFVAGGLSVVFDLPISSDEVCSLVGLPAGTPVRMAMLSDEELTPMRFELLEAPGVAPWDGEVRAGMAWPLFRPAALPSALDLPWLSVTEVAPGAHRCVAPGGVLVELRG